MATDDNDFPEFIKKVFREYETSEPCNDIYCSIPPRNVTKRAKDFLANVDWSMAEIPDLYSVDILLDMVWEGLGITVHPDGIDVYVDATKPRLIEDASVKCAVKVARKQKNFFKG